MKDIVSRREFIERKRIVIALFCGSRKPPLDLMDDDNMDALQDWVGTNQEGLWRGMTPTNLSVIEAAEALAESQMRNGYEMALDKNDQHKGG